LSHEKSCEWQRVNDRVRVTYRFRVRVRFKVRANFHVHFADSVFDISIFGGWR